MEQYAEKRSQKPGSSSALLWCLIVVVIGAAIYFFWPANKNVIIMNQVPLKGILYSDDNPSAVIDNEVLYEGDSFKGIKIVKIHKNKVEFERGNKKWSQEVGN